MLLGGRQLGMGAVIAVLLWCNPDQVIAATIVGSVELPEVSPRRPPVHRYGLPPNQPVEPPDPPVAVVYLERVGEGYPAQEESAVTIAQQGLQFSPAVTAVRVGTAVRFPNKDSVFHNVFSYSRNHSFDLGRYMPEDEAPVRVFDRPGVVQLFCEVHSHMRGVILVLESPWFTVTDATGAFRLEGLPEGSHTLCVWFSERRQACRSVELRAGETLHLDLP